PRRQSDRWEDYRVAWEFCESQKTRYNARRQTPDARRQTPAPTRTECSTELPVNGMKNSNEADEHHRNNHPVCPDDWLRLGQHGTPTAVHCSQAVCRTGRGDVRRLRVP